MSDRMKAPTGDKVRLQVLRGTHTDWVEGVPYADGALCVIPSLLPGHFDLIHFETGRFILSRLPNAGEAAAAAEEVASWTDWSVPEAERDPRETERIVLLLHGRFPGGRKFIDLPRGFEPHAVLNTPESAGGVLP